MVFLSWNSSHFVSSVPILQEVRYPPTEAKLYNETQKEMILQFNTDNNIEGTEALEQMASEKIQRDLKHYLDHITRLEVHLSDQNADKAGADDIQCRIEARVQGKKPVITTARDRSKEAAISEASDKMKAALRTMIGKMRN